MCDIYSIQFITMFRLHLHRSLNISRSSYSFSTVPPIVNAGEWGCIVHDLKTINALVLLAFREFLLTHLREKCDKPKITIVCCHQKFVCAISVQEKENDLNRKFMLLVGDCSKLISSFIFRCRTNKFHYI